MALNFIESYSRFCVTDIKQSTLTTCPTGHYCLELRQLEYTNDFEKCDFKCGKRDGNSYTTCDVIPSIRNSTDLHPVEEKPCTAHPSSKLWFESLYTVRVPL